MISEIRQCLTLLKEALHCPICLDDLKTPVITPCAHIFCNFCIIHHISSKRYAKCPLCNKQLTKRALKSADKVKEIAAASEEIFENFAVESLTPFTPMIISEPLHLSQELSQAMPTFSENKLEEKLSPPPITRPRRISTLARRETRRIPGTSSNRRVVSLGTSARVHKHTISSNRSVSTVSTDEVIESTQPMRDDIGYIGEVVPTQPMRETDDVKLFAFTQVSQPCLDGSFNEDTSLKQSDSNALLSIGERLPQIARPRCGAAMQRINSELLSGTFRTTFAVGRPSRFSAILRRDGRNISGEESGRVMPDAENAEKRSSKLSLASLTSLKRKSFLHGWTLRKRKSAADAMESPGIPPLRERISSRFRRRSFHAPTVSTTPRRRWDRKPNEMYSPWLNTRLHFLKKYRVGSTGKRLSHETRKKITRSPHSFSPGWSHITNLRTEFQAHHIKAQLAVRSTRKGVPKSDHAKLTRSLPQNRGEPGASELLQKPGVVCPFLLPLKKVGYKEEEELATKCSQCGKHIWFATDGVDQAVQVSLGYLTAPPIMHDKASYWPGRDADLNSQLNSSQEAASVITIQPSCVPQTWSYHMTNDISTNINTANTSENVEQFEAENQKLLGSSKVPEFEVGGTKPSSVHAVTEPISLSIPQSVRSSMHTLNSIQPSLVPETPLICCDLRNTQFAAQTFIPENTGPYTRAHGEHEGGNELETEVAQLQQQLAAEAMSPETTMCLLANAGTEPYQEGSPTRVELKRKFEFLHCEHKENDADERDEEYVGFLSRSPGNPHPAATRSPDISISDVDHGQSVMEIRTSDSNRAPDTNGLEAIDMIPSSQVEELGGEEMDDTIVTPVVAEPTLLGHRPIFSSNGHALVTDSNWMAPTVTRVDNSQTSVNKVSCALSNLLPISVHNSKLPAQLSQLQGPNKCADTMPFSLPGSQSAEQQVAASVIEDTENVAPMGAKSLPSIFITGSNLSPMEMNSLHRFCRQFNVVEDARFVPGRTTHVVMATETIRPRVAQRTLKYFMGILHRSWVVNTMWIRKCLLANTLLNEELFEIQGDTVCGDCHEGPRRSRLRVPALPTDPLHTAAIEPGLSTMDRQPFSGLNLCPHGDLGALSESDFIILVETGGGVAISNPSAFATATQLVASSQGPDAKRRHIVRNMILTSPSSPKFSISACVDLYNKFGVPIVNINWLLNCISVYRRLPMNKIYIIHPCE